MRTIECNSGIQHILVSDAELLLDAADACRSEHESVSRARHHLMCHRCHLWRRHDALSLTSYQVVEIALMLAYVGGGGLGRAR